jgi:short-subunit dehydrogenase
MTQPGYALVTGASRGLGKYFAAALARRKQNLVLVARSNERLEKVAEKLRAAHGVSVETISIDLARSNAGRDLARELRERNLVIDLLVNNAGFGDHGEFVKLSLERQLEMIRLQNSTAV